MRFGFAVFAWFILFLITTGGNCLAEFVARGMVCLTYYSLCGIIRGLAEHNEHPLTREYSGVAAIDNPLRDMTTNPV